MKGRRSRFLPFRPLGPFGPFGPFGLELSSELFFSRDLSTPSRPFFPGRFLESRLPSSKGFSDCLGGLGETLPWFSVDVRTPVGTLVFNSKD